MRRRLLCASVGVIPFISTLQTEAALPHKLFQYMALGLPTVVSDCSAMRGIVESTGAGLVARAGDSTDLAEKILSLADEEQAARVSSAALRAHRERFSLAAEGSALLELYGHLAQ